MPTTDNDEMSQKSFEETLEIVRTANSVPKDCPLNYKSSNFKKEYAKLSGMICFNSVQYYTYLSGIYRKEPKGLVQDTPAMCKCFINVDPKVKIMTDAALRAIEPGHALIFYGVDINGAPNPPSACHVAHAMISLGKGVAMGSNNGQLGLGGNWLEANIADLVEFAADGAVTVTSNKNRLGYLFSNLLRYSLCNCDPTCTCKTLPKT